MKTELILKFIFEASHSLAGFEAPHPHLWHLEFAVAGVLIEGRIIDIVQLRTRVQKLVDHLSFTYLNENTLVNDEVRRFPTCETLSLFFKDRLEELLQREFLSANRTVHLTSVLVALSEIDGTEKGAVKLTIPNSQDQSS